MKTALFFVAALAIADPRADILRAQELNQRIHDTIPYVASPREIKEPWDTFANGGDCADMSALLVHLLEREGIPAKMVVILPDGEPHHAYVEVWGRVIDPVSGGMFGEFPIPHKLTRVLGHEFLLWDWWRQAQKQKENDG